MRLTRRQKASRRASEASLNARRKRKLEKQAEVELARVKRRKSDPKEGQTITPSGPETDAKTPKSALQRQQKEKVQSLTASQLYFNQLRGEPVLEDGKGEDGTKIDVDVEESLKCKLETEEMNGFDFDKAEEDDEEAAPFTQLKLTIIPPPKRNKKRRLITRESPPDKPPAPPPKNCFICRRLLTLSDKGKLTRSHCLFLLIDLLGLTRAQAILHLRQFCQYDTWIACCPSCHPLIEQGAREREEIRKLKARIKKRQQTFLIRFKPEKSFKNSERIPALENIRNLVRTKGQSQSTSPDPVSLAEREDENVDDSLKDQLLEAPLPPTEASSPTPVTVFYCGLCTDDKVYSSQAELQSHTDEVHPPNQLDEEEEDITEEIQMPATQPRSKGLYSCPTCPGVRKYDINRFAQHLAIHQRLPYKCSACHIFLPQDLEQGEQHWTDKHPDVQLSPEQAKFLEAKVIPGKFWRCKGSRSRDCFSSFAKEESRDIHERKCPGANGISNREDFTSKECLTCKKTFRNLDEWRLHRVLHHPEKDSISCLYCDAVFGKEGQPRNEEKMLLHIRDAHEGDMPKKRSRSWNRYFYLYQIFKECEPCGLVFSREKQGHDHFMQTHGGSGGPSERVPLYCCPVCRKGYNNWGAMILHAERNHFLEESICDLCGNAFKGLTKLLEHKLREHDLNPGEEHPVYTCKEPGCQYKTVVKGLYAAHSNNVHAPKNSFKCKYCGQGIKNSAHLREHQLIHENKESKPHQCEICGNSFALKNYLYIHKRLSHEGRYFPSTNKKREGPHKQKIISGPDKSSELNSEGLEGVEESVDKSSPDSADCVT